MPNLPIVDIDGEEIRFGCLPRQMTQLGDGTFREVSDDWVKRNPPESWRETFERIGSVYVGNAEQTPWIYQGNQGSCTFSASCHCVMAANKVENEDVEPLSQATGYAWSGVRSDGSLIKRTSDNGMSLDFALYLMRRIGIAPASVIEPMDYRGAWRDTDDWKRAAAENRVTEWLDGSRSMEHLMAGLAETGHGLHGYGQHARMLVRPRWTDGRNTDYPSHFDCKNTWRNQKWHTLTWAQVNEGRRIFSCFFPSVTIAR